MSVKLPLLANAPPPPRAAALAQSLDPAARPFAPRAWLAVIGPPGHDAPARFACALSRALDPRNRYAILSEHAPLTIERALGESGARVLRSAVGQRGEPLLDALTAVPAGALVLVVEPALAAQLRGLLELWVGPAPGPLQDPQLARLYVGADVVLPTDVAAVARALGAALAPALASGVRSYQ